MLASLFLINIHPFFACTLPGAGSNSFFGFPHWWEYLDGKPDPIRGCVPDFNFPADIWSVALAIVDILLRFAGLAAVISIVYAGISYITAAGNAENITKARKRIVNSLVGLAIVLVAIEVVHFISKTFS